MITRAPFIMTMFLFIGACSGPGEPSSGEQEGGPFLRCGPTRDDGVKESFKLAPLVVRRDGYELEVRGIERGVVVLGLLAGINEPNPATMENLTFFLQRFKAAGVQAVVVAGGVGLLKGEMEGILAGLAKAPVPVFISPGAQESLDVFRESIEKAGKKSPQLIDMTVVRRVRMGHISLISLPGYHDAFYLEARERGCSYEPGDLADVASLAKGDRTTVIVSASPPLGKGVHSVDRGRGGVNIGDTALERMLVGAQIKFGLFGHVYESGGQATQEDGKTPAAQGVWHDTLYVQAGAVEAVPLTLVEGGSSVGMAQVVELSGNRGRFRTIFATGSNGRK